VDLPLIVDADTGFGNALNVYHTVRTLERAGADCIQLEDQVAPKRCGHFSGKDVISTDERSARSRQRSMPGATADLMIMARTDACATHGFEAAIERAQKMARGRRRHPVRRGGHAAG
jgi:2-methylisocitrate lyase-like PEP mutase family enzyme